MFDRDEIFFPDPPRRTKFSYTAALLPLLDLFILVLLGFFAGLLGGMMGIGGSVIMIPVLTLAMKKEYHLAQAAAMVVNVFVAAPAMLRHHRAGAVRWDLLKRMLPFALVAIIIGVILSNYLSDDWLKFGFGLFLIYVIIHNIQRLTTRRTEPVAGEERLGWGMAGSLGAVMGFVAGLLGIGGGGIAVPLLQRLGNFPLRQCIATSSGVMCITAVVGSLVKNLTLTGHLDLHNAPLRIEDSLLLAVCLAPTAIIGGHLGAGLTHSVPLGFVRIVFILLLGITAVKLLGIV